MKTFGERLKAERERLGMSQSVFAALGGGKKNAQGNYEANTKHPTSEYLARLAKHDVDINFLFYGVYANTGKKQEVDELIQLVTQLPPEHKAMSYSILSLFLRAAALPPSTPQLTRDIWRASKVYDTFLAASEHGKAIIEKAAAFDSQTKL